MNRVVPIALAIALVIAGVFLWSSRAHAPTSEKSTDQVLVSFGENEVIADVVDTPEERAQGLSGRETLSETEGMLFIFEEDGLHSFWMKDMLISIDMIWLSSEEDVVHIERNVSPDSYPSSFKPDRPARYVLEVPAGWTARHGVEVGSEGRFSME